MNLNIKNLNKKIITTIGILAVLAAILSFAVYANGDKTQFQQEQYCYKKIEFSPESQKYIDSKYFDIVWDNLSFKNKKLAILYSWLTEEEKKNLSKEDYSKEARLAKIKFTKKEFLKDVRLGVVDLNKDGQDDFVYQIHGRFGYPSLCGHRGCSLYILVSQENNSYTKVGCYTSFLGPICILNSETNGFRDMELLGYRKFDKEKNILRKSILKYNKNKNIYTGHLIKKGE